MAHGPIAARCVCFLQSRARHLYLHAIFYHLLQSMNAPVDLVLEARSVKRFAYHQGLLLRAEALLSLLDCPVD
ncbi:hypothetical protein BURKHO8Y_230011 [Burkholderia sp. 8Y]|nr:hypothetical protein BURKHO8Y_230011 [Burkholderia sp. 8Y]